MKSSRATISGPLFKYILYNYIQRHVYHMDDKLLAYNILDRFEAETIFYIIICPYRKSRRK